MKSKKAPNPTDVHVGKRVRMRRMMLGMSQEKLAGALGLTFQQIQKYEKGMNRVSASRLQQMSGKLEVPVAFFFEGLPGGAGKDVDLGGDPAIIAAFFSLPYAKELAEHYIAIPHNVNRRLVVDVARVMKPGDQSRRKVAA